MSDHPTRAELVATLRGIHDEAAGLLHLDVVLPDDFPDLALSAMRHEPGAKVLFDQVARAIADVHATPRRSPKLCGSCPRRIRRGDVFAVALATPACDDPPSSVALVICGRCGPDRASVKVAAAKALTRIWPDLRDITITHEAGGAA